MLDIIDTIPDAKFQFSPLREGRPIPAVHCAGTSLFQFSPLREGRPRPMRSPAQSVYFNSRPCERGDITLEEAKAGMSISILAPARGATEYTAGEAKREKKFQFSPLREGRHRQFRRSPCGHEISILAPARGATAGRVPDHEARHDFNSRPCERGDADLRRRGAFRQISILAPARGATHAADKLIQRAAFQFSPLREGRLHLPIWHRRSIYFNSRPCERGDVLER